jgi:hypothetical protein
MEALFLTFPKTVLSFLPILADRIYEKHEI